MNVSVPSILAASNPMSHVIDQPLWGQWIISSTTVMTLLAALITAGLLIPAARRIQTGSGRSVEDFKSQGLWANFVEAVCMGLREQIFRPVLGEETDRYAPVLWTLFWYILICNLLGLVPLRDLTAMFGLNHGHGIGGTATQSIWVTGGLALVAFLFWNGVALYKDWQGWFKHLTGGTPWFVWPVMIPVEILGIFIKPFALAVRLFANMTAGHVLLAVMLGFVTSMVQTFGETGFALAVVPTAAAVAVNMLEILVALVQAFIFTFLTAMFLGQLVAHEGEEQEHHGEAAHAS